MHTKLKSARPEMGQEAVAEIISKYNLLALPVVDDGNFCSAS
jgi:Mg/Co/Ni transporter MgtE